MKRRKFFALCAAPLLPSLCGFTRTAPPTITLRSRDDDLRLLELRQFQAEEIARWFKVPPRLIADLDYGTYRFHEDRTSEYLKLLKDSPFVTLKGRE